MPDEKRFLELKRKILDQEYGGLNPRQREAVYSVRGPLLILAGAGSGKTTVLVNKIDFAVKYGDAYYSEGLPRGLTDIDMLLLEEYAKEPQQELAYRVEELLKNNPAPAWGVLAFTFTNKAAGELKERLKNRLGPKAAEIWAGTFHSVCVRILRRHISRIGYEADFTIYDTDDQKKIVKEIIKVCRLEEKHFPPASVLAVISRAKDAQQSAAEFCRNIQNDYRLNEIGRIYKIYEERLRKANALDFDDIILLAVRLLRENEEVRAYWQSRFSYVYVDEYQDTNMLQYNLVSLLAGGTGNLTVVGDDDQSIYRFRGATIENILGFEKTFPRAKVIRLEQNYRSTSVILDSANTLIKNNSGRKGKTLWTDRSGGELIRRFTAENEYEEARFIAEEILRLIKEDGRGYEDFSALYRNNSQSSALEDAIRKNGIPYKIVKGLKFYDRKEVKDAVAYLSVMVNPADDQRLRRIINEPRRGIGDATMETAAAIAEAEGKTLYGVIANAKAYMQLERAAPKLLGFVAMIEGFKESQQKLLPSQVLKKVLEASGYLAACKAEDENDGRDRLSNLEALISGIENYETGNDEATISGFLQEVALASELDGISETGQYVTLLTMHSAKGLEYPVVFITGMEEGIFPSARAIEEPGGLEEERRLAYVAITRAKQLLYITRAQSRRSYYGSDYHMPSRFLKELPAELVEDIAGLQQPTSFVKTYHSGEIANKREPSAAKLAQKAAAQSPLRDEAEIVTAGDRVTHHVFGEGSVLSVREMGGDALVEVVFDSGVTKKLMQNFAKLKKL